MYAKVVDSVAPEIDPTKSEYIYELPPQQINGVWTQVFAKGTRTQEEINASKQALIQIYQNNGREIPLWLNS